MNELPVELPLTTASPGDAWCVKAKLKLTAERAQQVTPKQDRENKGLLVRRR